MSFLTMKLDEEPPTCQRCGRKPRLISKMLDPETVRRGRLGLSAPITVERGPGAGECEQRPVLIESEPHHVLLRLRVRFGKAVGRDEAPVFRLQPHAPMRR